MFRESPLHKNAPLFAAVESDVVGYTTIEMEAGKWYMIGSPFVPLQANTTFKVNEQFSGQGFGGDDTLYTLKSDGTFIPHYWISDTNGEGKWYADAFGFEEDTADYPLSTAVYIKKAVEGEIVFSGKVSVVKVEIGSETGNSWSLVAPVYPMSKKINDYEWIGFTTSDTLYTLRDTGVFEPNYWVTDQDGKGKWYKDAFGFDESTTLLSVGQAIYVNKTSAGIGTIELK